MLCLCWCWCCSEEEYNNNIMLIRYPYIYIILAWSTAFRRYTMNGENVLTWESYVLQAISVIALLWPDIWVNNLNPVGLIFPLVFPPDDPESKDQTAASVFACSSRRKEIYYNRRKHILDNCREKITIIIILYITYINILYLYIIII